MEMIEFVEYMMANEFGEIGLWLLFILLIMMIDIVTGFLQAIVNKSIKSGKMSTGLLKKSAILMVLIAIVPFTILLPDTISNTVIIGVYLLETINEFVSILENLDKMGVKINFLDPLMKLLAINESEENKK